MRVRPKLAYRHANYPSNTALDPARVYDAEIATNQPDYEAKGKIFVQGPNGAPAMLLERGEYETVD
jgi:hypothetical protein